jgi:hypothetical protein
MSARDLSARDTIPAKALGARRSRSYADEGRVVLPARAATRSTVEVADSGCANPVAMCRPSTAVAVDLSCQPGCDSLT